MLLEETASGKVEGHLRNRINQLHNTNFELLWVEVLGLYISLILNLFFLLPNLRFLLNSHLGLSFRLDFSFLLLSRFRFSSNQLSSSLLNLHRNFLYLPFILNNRNDSLTIRINFIHLILSLHTFSDIVDGSVDDINERL